MNIWYAQVALWVHEDVCRAIAEVNKPAKSVEASPIKRIMSFTLPFGQGMYVRPVATGENGVSQAAFTGAGGADLGPPANAEPKRAFIISPTGRACNSMYDVVAFTVVLHVDQTKIPEILKALSQNRFITVRGMDLTRVDVKPLEQAGYVYGANPIAEITLDCEMLLLREWTVPWMPSAIKAGLIGPGVDYQFQLKKNVEKKPE
jgi:hypothetical protein